MDFINIRQLIYRERKSLDEFDILSDDKSKITPFLYERLIQIDYLHPKHKNSNTEILRILNDVFFYHTLFFRDDNPLSHYADYQQISNPDNSTETLSKNRQWVEMSIAYVILNRFNETEWFREKKSHAMFFDIIKEEIDKHKRAYMVSMLSEGEATIEDKIINTITSESEGKRFIMIINRDFHLRDIQEIIDSGESLQYCLFAGDELREAVNKLCKDNEQKIQLIDRLLEPEKEHYGVLDSTICAAYRSLYELKSELTGEPLPEKLPFEKASTFTPPMMPTPSSVIEYQSNEEDEDDEEDVDEEGIDDRDEIISELTEKVERLTDEVNRLTHENSELRKKIADGGETEWIGCFDGFLHSSLDAKAIADALNNISSPHLPKNERSYWWVFYVSLLEINWILDSANHNTILKWVNLHFNLGWDWRSEQLFKFTIGKKYKVKHSSEWELLGTTGKYYAELSKRMKDTFVKDYEGKLFDRKKFVLPECKSPNERVTKE